jgi:hypothetical protein
MIDFERRTSSPKYDPSADTNNEAAYSKAKAEITELRAKESICSEEIEAILRSRHYTSQPIGCSNLSDQVKP